MEELIELLQQIQELAGVGIDALENAAQGGGEAPPPEEGEAPPKGGEPPEGPGQPPEEPPAE